MLRSLFLLLTLLLAAAPAAAQEGVRPAPLVRAWAEAQRSAAAPVQAVTLVEEARWTLDGPQIRQRVEAAFDVEVQLRPPRWDRRLRQAVVNGRPAPPPQWERLERRRRDLMGPRTEPLLQSPSVLFRLLEGMEPAGAALPEAVDGRPAWRVELVPRGRPGPVERMTLWLHRDASALLRSRLFVHTERPGAPFVVETAYARFEGLDLPVRRRVEGTVEMQRRLRTFTLLYRYDATYGDYRLR